MHFLYKAYVLLTINLKHLHENVYINMLNRLYNLNLSEITNNELNP